MNQVTYDLLTAICDKCGGRCCYFAKPPLTEERITILLENGMTFDDILFQNYRKLACKSTGFCVGYRNGRCTVQDVKPETCVAGPFTFDVKRGQPGDLPQAGAHLRDVRLPEDATPKCTVSSTSLL